MHDRICRNSDPPWIKQFAAYAMHQATRWYLRDIDIKEAITGLRREGRRRRIDEVEVEWMIACAFGEYGVDYGDIRREV